MFKSILKPDASIGVALATAGLAYGVYSFSLPNTATMHATQAHDNNIESARKKAAWTAVAIVGAVSLLTKDVTVFTIGGMTVVALDWHARHANAVSPETGQLVDNNGYQPAQNVVPIQTQAASY